MKNTVIRIASLLLAASMVLMVASCTIRESVDLAHTRTVDKSSTTAPTISYVDMDHTVESSSTDDTTDDTAAPETEAVTEAETEAEIEPTPETSESPSAEQPDQPTEELSETPLEPAPESETTIDVLIIAPQEPMPDAPTDTETEPTTEEKTDAVVIGPDAPAPSEPEPETTSDAVVIGPEPSVPDDSVPPEADASPETEASESDPYHDVFNFAASCISLDLTMLDGYDVFAAIALVGDKAVKGVAFTNYDTLFSAEGDDCTVWGVGFLQLLDEERDGDVMRLDEAMVTGGITVLPLTDNGLNEAFVIDRKCNLDPYSGILHEHFFKYEQESSYVMSIKVAPNDPDLWDEDVDLVNFDQDCRTVWKAEMGFGSVSAEGFYGSEEAYKAAVEAVKLIAAQQDEKGTEAKMSTMIVFHGDVLAEWQLNGQEGTVNDFLLDEINSLKLAGNEFVIISPDGVSIGALPTAQDRINRGLITAIGGILLAAGSIVIAIVTWGTTAPLAVSCIVTATGACAAAYGIFQTAEGMGEILYGLAGDTTSDSVNPLRDVFRDMVGDDEEGDRVYHAWGMANALLPALLIPAGSAFSVAKMSGATVAKTTLMVSRAAAVSMAKVAVTSVGAGLAAVGVKEAAVGLGASESLGELIGFGAAIATGALIYKGVNKFDVKHDISGYYTKEMLYRLSGGRKDLANQFDSANWKKLDTAARKDLLSQLGDDLARGLDLRKKPTIEYFSDPSKPGFRGEYIPEKNVVRINEANLSKGLTLLRTLIHEFRHAWQCQTFGIKECTSGYIPPVEGGDNSGYLNQWCEKDADNFVNQWIEIWAQGVFG